MVNDKTEEEKKKASQDLSQALKEMNEALERAKKIADEFGLTFSMYPTYGMGGSYYGANFDPGSDEDYHSDYRPSDDKGYWITSSNSC